MGQVPEPQPITPEEDPQQASPASDDAHPGAHVGDFGNRQEIPRFATTERLCTSVVTSPMWRFLRKSTAMSFQATPSWRRVASSVIQSASAAASVAHLTLTNPFRRRRGDQMRVGPDPVADGWPGR